MYERDSIRVSTGAPWNETPDLLRNETVDIVFGSTRDGKRNIEFTDKLPQDLINTFEGLELTLRLISGKPRVYQLHAINISEMELMCIIDGWAEKEGKLVEMVVFSEKLGLDKMDKKKD